MSASSTTTDELRSRGLAAIVAGRYAPLSTRTDIPLDLAAIVEQEAIYLATYPGVIYALR